MSACVCVFGTMSVLWRCEGVSVSSELHEASRSIAEQVCLIAFTLRCVMRLECFFDEYVQTHMQIKTLPFCSSSSLPMSWPIIFCRLMTAASASKPASWAVERERKDFHTLERETKEQTNSKSTRIMPRQTRQRLKKNTLYCKNIIIVVHVYAQECM